MRSISQVNDEQVSESDQCQSVASSIHTNCCRHEATHSYHGRLYNASIYRTPCSYEHSAPAATAYRYLSHAGAKINKLKTCDLGARIRHAFFCFQKSTYANTRKSHVQFYAASQYYVDAADCYRRSSVVCRSVGPSVMIVSPAKTAEPIEMPFGLWARVGPRTDGGS